MPNKKAGPALLQNASMRCAVCGESCPALYASAIPCAPTGYPPRNPDISSGSAPVGIPHNWPILPKKGSWNPDNVLFSKIDSTKNGNKDGMTVIRQSCTPLCAPARAVFPSKINISIPKQAPRPARSVFCFTALTSKESMQEPACRFIC